ncbi:hypothetical protein N0B51_14590 [Tsuneonella sp. YG55]|uniref:Uncharacterized protein n=1 Tax=Tsuneonella litorea TaxID=2976475 RepID=A0A9X3AM74_9SPHN|nr:hypothetical protein [Tsuneonella litorea]MCT2560208.1 hypothetical protein [Tsuneonella litorea]
MLQPLDAAGHLGAEAVAAGSNSTAAKIVSSFDVLEDSLDYFPSDRGTSEAHQHQFHFALRLEDRSLADTDYRATTMVVDFIETFLAESPAGSLLRPPRI